ncbi:hypothetical protein FRC02_010932 [Tulasnella sp. 418]|nr:hypothetical protein FRC02_010932 [Tulasnella sp. 418]
MPPQRNASKSKLQKLKSKRQSQIPPAKPQTQETRTPTHQSPEWLSLRGVFAALVVDNRELQCYEKDINELTRTATCFVESEAGKSYYFQLKRGSDPALRGVALSSALYIDGDPTPICKNLMESERDLICVRSIPSGPNETRPLVFSPVETTGAIATMSKR